MSDKEVERYAAIADQAIKAGESYETAIRKAMKPILVSPYFLLALRRRPRNHRQILSLIRERVG